MGCEGRLCERTGEEDERLVRMAHAQGVGDEFVADLGADARMPHLLRLEERLLRFDERRPTHGLCE
jgi:hypothetical protein